MRWFKFATCTIPSSIYIVFLGVYLYLSTIYRIHVAWRCVPRLKSDIELHQFSKATGWKSRYVNMGSTLFRSQSNSTYKKRFTLGSSTLLFASTERRIHEDGKCDGERRGRRISALSLKFERWIQSWVMQGKKIWRDTESMEDREGMKKRKRTRWSISRRSTLAEKTQPVSPRKLSEAASDVFHGTKVTSWRYQVVIRWSFCGQNIIFDWHMFSI